jgi:hypothetical protein
MTETPERRTTTGTPRWVKVAGIIALLVVLLLVIVIVTDGEHGPGRHTPSDNPGGHTAPPSGVTHEQQL